MSIVICVSVLCMCKLLKKKFFIVFHFFVSTLIMWLFLKKQNFMYYNHKIWQNPVVLWCVMSLNDSAQAAFKKQLKINLVESYFQLLQKLIKVISGYRRRGYMHNVLMDKPCKSCVSKLYRHQNRYFYNDMNYVLCWLFLNLNIVFKMTENCSCNTWKHVM